MKFKKVILANWANIPNQEYDLSDLVFLTGETGVGKSTMLDAIQTLMTANKKGIVLYNAGQDEAQNKKRNKEYRTIQGYFAGEDRFKFSRPNGCRSTIVLSFQNSINEEKYEFSALITGVVSFEESKGEKRPILDSLKFFIIKSHEILQEDLIDENKQLLNHKELYKNLSLKYDKDNVIHCQDKSDYLNTLYGNLWGKNRTTSLLADKAARAFSNFIHARPVDNINAFVRNEFLSSKDMKDEVNALSSTIRSLDKLKKDAKEIEDSINILESLENKTNVIVRKWHSLGEEHFIYNHYEVLKVENKMIQDEKKYEKIRREIVRLENKEKKLDLDSVNFNEKLLELEIAKNSNDKIKELNDIEKKLQDTKKAFNIGTSNVIRIISNIENISRDTASIFLYREKFENLTRLLNELKIVLDEFSSNSFNQYFFNNDINSEDIEYQVISFRDLLDKVIEKYQEFVNSIEFKNEKDKLEKEFIQEQIKRENLLNDIKTIKSEIKSLKENRFFCPANVQESLNILKQNLPLCNAHLLYEYVELLDDNWRESIEGFIGNNRFCVIVASEYEKEAIDLIKTRNLNIKIIQGKKVLEELKFRGKSLDEKSIVNLLKISNEKAQAYLILSYGDVLQIESSNELTSTRRGLTKDCKAASGNLLFTCALRDKRFIFGEEAQRKTLYRMENDLDSLEKQRNKFDIEVDILRQVLRFTEKFKENKELVNLEEIRNINANYNKYHEALKTKELIDTSDFEEIIKEIENCNLKQTEIKRELSQILQDLGSNKRSFDEKDKVYALNEKILEEKNNIVNSYRLMHECVYRNLVITSNVSFEEYEKNIISKIDVNLFLAIPNNLLSSLSSLFHDFETFFTVKRLSNMKSLPDSLSFDSLVICTNHFEELLRFKNDLLERVDDKKNSLSIKYKDEINQADKAFKNTFLNDFCHAIYVNIKQGEHSIDRLNDTLRKHKFGNETFKIVRKHADEELKRYQDYFKAIHEGNKNLEVGSLFEDLEKEGFEDISRSLLELFMDNEKHINELLRISDYRNYNNYDIFQEVDGTSISLSRNGKNSGGQGETSYYIIRSINLQSALRPSETNPTSLESIIIDESFLKSNEKRSKEILNYLNKSLGFQIICAMPTKNVGTFYEIESSNYHFVQFPLGSHFNGELDYKTFVEFKKRNNKEVKKLYEDAQNTLFAEIKKEADERYAE